MELTNKIRALLGNYHFQREVEKSNLKRESIGFDEAKKIGLLYDATRETDYEAVKAYVKTVRSEHKEILALGYVDKKELPSHQYSQYGLDFFTRKNLNFYMKPGSLAVTNFIEEPFDILINAGVNSCFPLRYIAALSHARFRVGRFDSRNTFCYDMMIDSKDSTGTEEFIKQVDSFLRKIKTKHGVQSV